MLRHLTMERDMDFKTIMVHLELGQSNDGLLTLAADLATRAGAAQVIGIAGCQPIQLIYDETYVAGEIMAADRVQIEAELKQAESRFRDAFRDKVKQLEWRCDITPASLADFIASEARAADLVISGPDIGGSVFDHARQVKIADLVFQAGRPVLVVPKEYDHVNLSDVMVGWKDTAECRRAVAAALPLLKLAGRISVVAIASEEEKDKAKEQVTDVVRWLLRHGLKVTGETRTLKGVDTLCFEQLVQEKAPGLIVAGAYGHSRLREWVLGGVTGDFLIDPDRPVFVAH
jgi:nucleotide-binding universal stress UspA family protein